MSDSLSNALSGVVFLGIQQCLIAEILYFCDAVANSSSFHYFLSSVEFHIVAEKAS